MVELLEEVRSKGVKFIQLWFVDLPGILKSVTIPVTQLKRALEDGITFDGSSIEGFTRIHESDMVLRAIPETFTILPWNPQAGRMFAQVLKPDGTPYEGDPRNILKRNLDEAKSMGFTFYIGPEIEYFYFKSQSVPEVLDHGGYFDNTPPDIGEPIRMRTVETLKAMGIEVEATHHEVAPSQHEIDLVYAEAMEMADRIITTKYVIKEIAQEEGYYASFMPKPLFGQNGSGMHLHFSLFKGDENAFYEDDGNLSEIGKKFIAGLLQHIKEITLILNQWENSYKRLVPGYEAPVYISWARKNRSTLIRVPHYPQHRKKAARAELRSPDPATNPYLAFAVILQAGLEGIRKGYELPPPIEANIYEMSIDERKAAGIEDLPGSLGEAIYYAERSELLRRTLGEETFFKYIRNRRMLWETYRARINQYEIEKYLPIL